MSRTAYPGRVRGLLIVNPSSGDSEPSAEELAAAARGRGVDVHVLEDGDDLEEIARSADADAVGMAGGDGSLAAVAGACLERDRPFVCIPFGTRNHFARDLGLNRDNPIAALAAFDGGEERRVDVGRAGDRLFLNNVSLGLYAQIVHRREHHRRRRVALARLRALGLLATHRGPLGITVDGAPIEARIVLVANNAYSLELLSIGERERIDEGQLHLYSSAGWRGGWEEHCAESFEIGAAAGNLRAAVDGEPAELETPIRFSIDPRALRVLVPRSAGEEAG